MNEQGTNTNDHLSKWQDWVAQIEDDIFGLWFDDVRFEQLQEIAALNPAVPSEELVGWVGNLLLGALALGVRRQADLRKDCISLARLATDVARHPEAFMAAPWYAILPQPTPTDIWSIGVLDIQHAARADASVVRDMSAEIRNSVSKTLAHWAVPKQREELLLDLKEVRVVTGRLRSMVNRYRLALTGSLFLSGPVPQYDWLDVFVTPLTTNEVLTSLAER